MLRPHAIITRSLSVVEWVMGSGTCPGASLIPFLPRATSIWMPLPSVATAMSCRGWMVSRAATILSLSIKSVVYCSMSVMSYTIMVPMLGQPSHISRWLKKAGDTCSDTARHVASSANPYRLTRQIMPSSDAHHRQLPRACMRMSLVLQIWREHTNLPSSRLNTNTNPLSVPTHSSSHVSIKHVAVTTMDCRQSFWRSTVQVT
mmetsp:Transcript_4073/g.10054  ORF Transcript_4073/g.10054 Transcript_4073/m.10054 type:complete len:203 (+) Transcript_4073:1066-1674(+)